jgi:hypothetical protein
MTQSFLAFFSGRKLLVAFILTFASSAPVAQYLALVALGFAQIGYELYYRPYYDTAYMVRDLVCEAALILYNTLAVAYYSNPEFAVTLQTPLLLLCWVVIVTQFIAIFYHTYKLARRFLQEHRVRAAFQNASKTLVSREVGAE